MTRTISAFSVAPASSVAVAVAVAVAVVVAVVVAVGVGVGVGVAFAVDEALSVVVNARVTLCILVALGVGCNDRARVIFETPRAEECAAHCVEALTATLGDLGDRDDRDDRGDELGDREDLGERSVDVPCGESIDLGTVEAGTSQSLDVFGGGPFAFRAKGTFVAARGEHLDLAFDFEPETRPHIEEFSIGADEVLYEPQEVDLFGVFGPRGGDSSVTVNGEALEIVEWTTTRVRVVASTSGPAVVTNCGLASSEVATPYRALRGQTFDIASDDCVSPRLLAGSSPPRNASPSDGPSSGGSSSGGSSSSGSSSAVDDSIFAFFSCEETCDSTWIGRIGLSSLVRPELTTPLPSPFTLTLMTGSRALPPCVGALSAVDKSVFFVGRPTSIEACRFEAALACEVSVAMPPNTRVTELSAISAEVVAFVAEGSTGSRQLRINAANGSNRLLRDVLTSALSVDGPFVLGTDTSSRTVVVEWKRPPPAGRVVRFAEVPNCPEPRRLLVHSNGSDEPRMVVLCERRNAVRVIALDGVDAPDGSAATASVTSTTDVRDVDWETVADASLDARGRVLWIASQSGLWFVDLASGRLLGHRAEAIPHSAGKLIRSPNLANPANAANPANVANPASDTFLLGGPSPGQVTLWEVK